MKAKIRLDHVSLLVRCVATSAAFYRDVLLLPEVESKIGKPNIRWFGIGDTQTLHLIQGEFGETLVKIATHFCISTDKFNEMKSHLTSRGVPFFNLSRERNEETIRRDGVRQIYLNDPDGYWLELNDDPF